MENRSNKNKKKSEVYVTLSPFRNLNNYKLMHEKQAEKKGRLAEFVTAPTLTAARRIAFG